MTDDISELRPKLAIALDVDDLIMANRLARAVSPYFGVAKIGLELFSAAGPEAIGVMKDLGMDVFLDVKLHDIPTTVGKSARVLGALGVRYLTLAAKVCTWGPTLPAKNPRLRLPSLCLPATTTLPTTSRPAVCVWRSRLVVAASCVPLVTWPTRVRSVPGWSRSCRVSVPPEAQPTIRPVPRRPKRPSTAAPTCSSSVALSLAPTTQRPRQNSSP